MIKFGSVCSGIEAASVAFNPLGWKAAWFSEIEKFPSAVLAHHYPDIPNLGDMTKLPEMVRNGEIEAPDVLCGGTPCQAFSVAGLRKSLNDSRGNLSLTFCELADEIDAVRFIHGRKPALVFWENVPGVLSTSDNAFGCILAKLAGADFPIRTATGRFPSSGVVGGRKRLVCWRVLNAQHFGTPQVRRRVFLIARDISKGGGANPAKILFEYSGSDGDSAPLTGAADTKRIRRRAEETNSKPVIVYDARHREGAREYRNIVPTLIAAMGTGGNNVPVLVDENGEIRKLTPTECERLQGFPDDYTKIPYNGKEPDKCPDMYRYRAIGNSWAVPVVRWLGKRIDDEMKGEDQ